MHGRHGSARRGIYHGDKRAILISRGREALNEIIGSGIERGRWSEKMMFDVDWQTAK